MEVTEGWRAAIADEGLRRRYPELDFDDAGWEPIASSSQWRSTPAFAATDGPLLYRTTFEASDEGARSWLAFDGIFYTADVWLDGCYVGDTEGYFVPHAFEVTELLRDRREHTLALEVACSRPTDLTQKRNITGVFQHWDCLDPDDNPGGIWRPVRIAYTGPVRIANLRVVCPRADSERATLELTADLDTNEALTVVVRTVVEHGGHSVDHEAEHTLAADENAITWRVDVDDPTLWWPHALGDANLAQVSVAVFVVADDGTHDLVASDTRSVTTGLRSVSMRDFRWTVNGERLFVKAVNHGPTTQRLADASPEQVVRDIDLAKQTNLDMVRVHAHVARPELYEAADRAGMLLWQDLPLAVGLRPRAAQAGSAPSARRRRPARSSPVDRGVVRAQRTDGHRHHTDERRVARQGHPGVSRRSTTPHVEQDHPRLDHQARLRARRQHAAGPRSFGSAAACRRHWYRHPLLLRLVSR